ncbi:glutathione peroxidase [Brachybacterium halotolerans subsp. kimchii]|uniref:glutathione peroxidase n=1 Tax=Brachybacterium halotolerans TaxID=2795215 RepID=UPI001E5C47C9|nr:glutathione peroxidase [Brachybacterium halotolerans]UEJ81934.1 glutathione peroxidase [Brachybacterium halotolerans subsp. kimchii]
MAAQPDLHASSPRTLTLHDFTATSITGEEVPLERYRGQLVLVVNTASRCLFTPQLRDLEDLHRRHHHQGFSVLGFPSDQFHQELEGDEQIEVFCSDNFDVTFPMFSTVKVNGPEAHPVFSWLQTQKGGLIGGRISWNFTKFLVSPEGRVLRRYAPPVPPSRIERRIREELGAGIDGT